MIRFRVAFLFVVAFGLPARSQEVTAPPAAEPDGRRLIGEHAQVIHVDPEQGILYLLGDVKVQLGDMTIRCVNLVAWMAKRPAGPREEGNPPLIGQKPQEQLAQAAQIVQEVYAEGMVIFTQGEEWVRADRVFFDLVNTRGIVVDATLAYPVKRPTGPPIPLVLRADELRFLSRDRMQASGVRTTACSFGHPHYHLASRQVEVIRERPGVLDPGEPGAPLKENYHVEAQDNVLYAGAFPVFWLPDFVGDSASGRPFDYIESVRLGRSSRYGYDLGLTIGDDIQDDKGRWGHRSVPLDYYTKRGPSAGVDLVYGGSARDYRGDLVTRGLLDHGSDRYYGDPPSDERGRITWHHRHKLPWEVQLDIELALFSDRGYYPTFFRDEYRTDKPPENLIYLKKAFFNSYLSALGTIRFNDWETVVEYQPELRYDLIYQPLVDLGGRPLYLDVTARVSKNRLKIDDDEDVRPRQSWRADVDTLVEYPFPAGPFTLTPFVGPRFTWYQEDLFDRKNQDRFGITSGATLAMQAWRIYDVHGGLFGLDGLRHVLYPEITFRDTSAVDLHPDELIPFDDVDAYDNLQSVEFRTRNLFQTVRHRPAGAEVENVIDLDTEITFFPRADRDQGGDPWSNLANDLIVRFSDAVQVAVEGEINFYGRGLEVVNTAVGYTPSREFQAYAGFRHYWDTYDAVFFQQNWRVEEKWMVTIESSYDFRQRRGLDHRVGLRRIGHDWILQFGLSADVAQDDYGFFFSLEPRMLFDPVYRPRALRTETRFLYLENGLTN